jgi:DNA-directed RNA polymerase specialized sigma24 family protein
MRQISDQPSPRHRAKCSHPVCQANAPSWVVAAQQSPPGSVQRNHYLNRIIREISPHLWRTNTPEYADAMQQTWLYFAKNICQTYDSERGCIVTWLNAYLWHRYQDEFRRQITKRYHEIPIDHAVTEGTQGWVVRDLAAPEYGSLALLDRVSAWVKSDPDSCLSRIHVRHRPDVNAQALVLLRLPPKVLSWQVIARRFNLPLPTVSSFYQRKCLPLLREFGRAEGML